MARNSINELLLPVGVRLPRIVGNEKRNEKIIKL